MCAVQRKAAEREIQRAWRAEMSARKEAKDRASQGPPKGQPVRWDMPLFNFFKSNAFSCKSSQACSKRLRGIVQRARGFQALYINCRSPLQICSDVNEEQVQ